MIIAIRCIAVCVFAWLNPAAADASTRDAAVRKACRHTAGTVTYAGPFELEGRTFHVAVSTDDRAWAQHQIQPACAVWLETSGAEAKVVAHGSVNSSYTRLQKVAVQVPGVAVPVVTALNPEVFGGGIIANVWAGADGERAHQSMVFLAGRGARVRLAGRGVPCPDILSLSYGTCNGVPVLDAVACLDNEERRTRHLWNAEPKRFDPATTSPPCALLADAVPIVTVPRPKRSSGDDGKRIQVTGSFSSGYVINVDSKPLVTLAPTSVVAVSPLRHTPNFVAVRVSRQVEGGATEDDLDLYSLRDGGRVSSMRLRRGPTSSDCEPEAFYDGIRVEVTSCEAGTRVVRHVPLRKLLVSPLANRRYDLEGRFSARNQRCYPGESGLFCVGEADEAGTSAAWFVDNKSHVSGVPELYGVKVQDALWRDGSLRVLVQGRGDGLVWRDVPLPSEGAPRAFRLLELAASGHMATDRRKLSSGAIVQMHAACTEGGGSHEGFVVLPPRGRGPPVIQSFPSGTMFESGGHLVVAARERVGSDLEAVEGEGLFARLPRGARLVTHSVSGAYEVSRLVAVDLKTARLIDAGYDAASPVSAGNGRFVAFRRYTGPRAFASEKMSERLELWDLAKGRLQVLDALVPGSKIVASELEVFAHVTREGKRRWIAINGNTGRKRDVKGPPATADEAPPRGSETSPLLSREGPPAWMTSRGEVILVSEMETEPSAGGCGVPGFWYENGILYTDGGAYFWPKGLPPPALGAHVSPAQ